MATEPLARYLGFEPVANPADQLAGPASPLRAFFETRTDRFGVLELYRIGGSPNPATPVGLYVVVLDEWGRSSERARARRRVARALMERNPAADARSVFVLLPHRGAEPSALRQAEFVFPRVGTQQHAEGVTTVRALVDLVEPTRFHRDLLRGISIPPDATLLAVSQQWQREFSVERVTRRFYTDYQTTRDRLAAALLSSNADHAVVRGLTEGERNAWATRQMGRLLFLWFLQAKRWLGYDGTGEGRADYFRDLWTRRAEAPGGFYRGMLSPLFFEGMARRNPSREVRERLGYTPYLNGGLFRLNTLEDRISGSGPVTLPDDLFDPTRNGSVLNLLDRYRFTTRESTPDDQSVDPDPELLGRVFENLYQADERHDSGTYYTPREIVHFMCRQALDGYLRDASGVDQDTLEWLRSEVTDPEESDRQLPRDLEERLVGALESIRVCDPAVGSGAFLLGMMHEMVQLRRGMLHAKGTGLHEEASLVAQWKRRAIQYSLYGVDINPEAVDICQLRLWLSLVLDMDNPRTGEPLPNLDFRIVAGDSLIDRVGDVVFKGSLPFTNYQPPMDVGQRIEQEERAIERWRSEYENTYDNPDRSRELRANISRAFDRIVRIQLEAHLAAARQQLQSAEAGRARTIAEQRVKQLEGALAGLKADAPYRRPLLWPEVFHEVFSGSTPGFDVVLANPPYVRMEKIDNEDERSYAASFPAVAAGRADLLVYFYARALQVLRDGGWLAFITSNKYMRSGYGGGLREHLAHQTAIHDIIDFGDLPLFESNGKQVAAYPAVVVAAKRSAAGEVHVADLNGPVRQLLGGNDRSVTPESVRWALESLDQILEAVVVDGYPQVLLKREGWILEHPVLVRLFERLMNTGIPLGKFVEGRIYRGVVTGLNEAFVIDQATRDRLVTDDPRSAEIVKPWLSGRDIKRWRPAWTGAYVIFANRGVDIDRYPAIKRHLAAYRAKLEKRATSALHPWYELQQPQEGIYQAFNEAKVVWPEIAKALRFSWVASGVYLNKTCFFAPSMPVWILPILHSPVVEFLLHQLTSQLRGGFLLLSQQYVAQIPIVEPGATLKASLADLALRFVGDPSAETATSLREISASVFGLSREDAAMIHEWTVQRDQLSNSVSVGYEEDE